MSNDVVSYELPVVQVVADAMPQAGKIVGLSPTGKALFVMLALSVAWWIWEGRK